MTFSISFPFYINPLPSAFLVSQFLQTIKWLPLRFPLDRLRTLHLTLGSLEIHFESLQSTWIALCFCWFERVLRNCLIGLNSHSFSRVVDLSPHLTPLRFLWIWVKHLKLGCAIIKFLPWGAYSHAKWFKHPVVCCIHIDLLIPWWLGDPNWASFPCWYSF